jgi:hypothetical protein
MRVELASSPLAGPLGLLALGPLRPEWLVSLAIEMRAPPLTPEDPERRVSANGKLTKPAWISPRSRATFNSA